MYEFWYTYIKPKYQSNAKLCYMDADSFIIHLKTENFYKDITHDVEKWFDTSIYEADTPLLRDMNKKVIGLIKDEIGGKIMIQLVAITPRTHSFLMVVNIKEKKEQRSV